jgi:S-formylglutathione hydrolase FrmB
MNFGVYLLLQAESSSVPVIYWLCGLTCTEANFIQKAGAQKYAAKHGKILITYDTSTRGEGIPDDPEYNFWYWYWIQCRCNSKTMEKKFPDVELYHKRTSSINQRKISSFRRKTINNK